MLNKALFILMITLMACSGPDEQEEQTVAIDVVKENGLLVPAPTELDTINPPELTFIDTEIDFGAVREGQEIYKTFKFKNTGQSPLIITDAKASCGCTVPKVPEYPVLPGENGEIEVLFNSKHKSGPQSKSICIAANTFPEKINKIKLKGHVVKSKQ